MSYQLGVDVGTTFTAAAVQRDGLVEIVRLGNHTAAIPSLVFLRADGDVLIGEAAERRGAQEPARLARAFKRRFGDATPILLDRTPVSAERLTAMILRQIIDEVATRQGGPAAAVGLAHPANWGDFKLDLLRQAAQLGGITNAVLVSEPVAAAIQYASTERVDVGDVFAVYDFGGGTFDAAVLRKTETGFDTLGTPQGIERLGGIDFDEAVFTHVRTAVGGAIDQLDTADPSARAAIVRLRQECVLAKEALTADSDATIPVMLPNLQTQVRLTRIEFEDMIRSTLRETVDTLRRAITFSGVELPRIKAILLAGGSSRIPLVSELIRNEFARPVVTDADPKQAVAMGAARAATTATRTAARTATGSAAVIPPAPPSRPVVPTASPAPAAATEARRHDVLAVQPLAIPGHQPNRRKMIMLSTAAALVVLGTAAMVLTQGRDDTTAPTTAAMETTASTGLSETTAPDITAAPSTSSPVTTVSVTGSPTLLGVVPDVVGVQQAEAEVALEAAGYLPTFYKVCSHSVAAGEVRQVLNAADGRIVVDLDGVVPALANLPVGTELTVKVGNGTACS